MLAGRYSMEQMFNVVSDVENYTSFVPFCKKSDVFLKLPTRMRANLEIGFPPVVERYTSDVTLERPTLVRAECTEGKLFDHLQTVWKFSPGMADNQQTCIIDFFVSFEFRSLLHSQLAHFFFNELVRQMENAFIQEVANRYGKASVKSRMLKNVHFNS
ncbi:coenzyme Q-binding protein COQ10 homolog B, mitochondrial isoform X2 [Bacillus rossius redtenbacheri]|uniref:coenzyme Q-binding protein COQ10 homolog B, mitochondrial isoform X2 n=1 Tax=Bacillus rossius redtenbacheri TaxID=93214 RepID=UPI002FDE0741